MRTYALVAVEDSKKAMEQYAGKKNALMFPMAKAGMRVANVFLGWKRT